jgi:Flp pilus assembly protein TadB
MTEILSNAPAQYGALGLLVIILAFAIGSLWRQLTIERREARAEIAAERKARDEDQNQSRKELLDLSERLIDSQTELQLLLKSLTDERAIEKLFREYIKKD